MYQQEAALQANLIATCLEQLNDPLPLLRQWLALCLGLTWEGYDQARWCGVRDSAHEKLFILLEDSEPEVRASAVFALGTFINSATERTDHANNIDHTVGLTLVHMCLTDGSPLVRKELVVALQWLILLFESQFVALIMQSMEDQKESPRQHSGNKIDCSVWLYSSCLTNCVTFPLVSFMQRILNGLTCLWK